jgi:hypothetical protein
MVRKSPIGASAPGGSSWSRFLGSGVRVSVVSALHRSESSGHPARQNDSILDGPPPLTRKAHLRRKKNYPRRAVLGAHKACKLQAMDLYPDKLSSMEEQAYYVKTCMEAAGYKERDWRNNGKTALVPLSSARRWCSRLRSVHSLSYLACVTFARVWMSALGHKRT